MTKQRSRSVPPYVVTFMLLFVLSLSNLFAWPRALAEYRDFFGHSLANSVFNGNFNRQMDPGIAASYLMVTNSVNYVVSLAIKIKPRWKGVGIFAITYLLASIAISVATMALYLVGEQGR